MASYKVPQDVEADDKLLGPFTFRQFIYLLIVAGLIAIAWGLSLVFVGLVIVPLPAILLFGALALPLKKDQPMEIYLAALISFYVKPRIRKWDPDGIDSNIEISAPKVIETVRTKSFTGTEAEQQLGFLADIVDTQGWAIRGLDGQNTAMNTSIYLEAQDATDILDNHTTVAQNFDHMMTQSTERLKEEARQRMFHPEPPQQSFQQTLQQRAVQQPVAPPQVPMQPPVQPVYQAPQQIIESQAPAVLPEFDPYPNFRQSVIQPLGDDTYHADVDVLEIPNQYQTVQQPPQSPPATEQITPQQNSKEDTSSTSDNELKADIINLASNTELSIETIARQANRLKKKAEKKKDDGEVVISLR